LNSAGDKKKKTRKPSVKKVIVQRRRQFMREIAASEKILAATKDETERSQLERHISSTWRRARRFENLIANPPEGMRLEVALHAPMTAKQKRSVRNEFAGVPSRQAFHHIGTHCAGELKAIGMSDRGIRLMAYGLPPADAEGRLYNVDLHHNEAIADAGEDGLAKVKDPLNSNDREKRYSINLTGNVSLQPWEVHKYITTLQHVQMPNDEVSAKPQHILAFMPVRDFAHSGLVAWPQPKLLPDGLTVRPHEPQSCVTRTLYIARHALKEVQAMKSQPEMRSLVRHFRAVSRDPGISTRVSIAELAERESHVGLRAVFEAAASATPGLRARVDTQVCPVLRDMVLQLEHVFAETSSVYAQGGRAKVYKRFRHHFGSGAMKELRRAANLLPMQETALLLRTFGSIERQMPVIEEQRRQRQQEKNQPAPRKAA
jgi:hypothetical protein